MVAYKRRTTSHHRHTAFAEKKRCSPSGSCGPGQARASRQPSAAPRSPRRKIERVLSCPDRRDCRTHSTKLGESDAHEIANACVSDCDALWITGGARCVDDVAIACSIMAQRRSTDRLPVHRLPASPNREISCRPAGSKGAQRNLTLTRWRTLASSRRSKRQRQGAYAGLPQASPETYVAMLAVLKVNAAYVPLDAALPIERIRFILEDADVSAILSMSNFAERLSGFQQVDKIFLDSERPAIDAQVADPLTGVAPRIEPLCYIIYTSGTTGNPKGVAIGHASICNFVRVAGDLWLCSRRSRLSGHDDRVRFFRRGDLGAADGWRDARAWPGRHDHDGRRACRLSRRTPCDRDGL